MKKTLIITLASIALVSCSQDETVATMDCAAIEFDKVYVDNATRAKDITTGTINNFSVYGFVEANGTQGMIFDNTPVRKNIYGIFGYEGTQYWIPNAQYYFTAIAPYVGDGENPEWIYETQDAQNGTISYDAAKDIDLLFSYLKPDKTTETITQKPDAVKFNFEHLLSRVCLTFVNKIPANSNITVQITGAKITNAFEAGTLQIENGVAQDWTTTDTNEDGNKVYEIGFRSNGSYIPGEGSQDANGQPVDNFEITDHHYLIPAESTYNIEFNVSLRQAGVEVSQSTRKASITLDLEKGISYNIKANLTADNVLPNALEPIEFNVNKVNGWQTNTTTDTNLNIGNN